MNETTPKMFNKKRQIRSKIKGQHGQMTVKEFCELCEGVVIRQDKMKLTVGKNGFKVTIGAEDFY